MSRVRVSLAVVGLVLLAGCAFGSGGTGGDTPDDGDVPTPGPATNAGATTSGGTPAAASTMTESETASITPAASGDGTPRHATGDHPFVEPGTLDSRALVRAHLDALSRSDSFLLTNNGTIRYAANGSLVRRIVSIRAVDLADERRSVLLQSIGPDGVVSGGSERFENATTTCTRFDGDVGCQAPGFDRRRAMGDVVEVTSLETVGGPAFEPNGTVRQNKRDLYRYTATSFRSSLSERTRSELGPNASLDRATLLVAANGRIVEYRIVYERDQSTAPRVRIDRTYRTLAVNATTVSPPPWVPT